MSDEYKITAQCRNGRHAVCAFAGMNADGFCDCECHDDYDPAAPKVTSPAMETVGPSHAARTISLGPSRVVDDAETFDRRTGGPVGVDEFPCREATCDHAPFSTKQGEQVHWQRMHSGKDPRHPKPAEPAPVVGVALDDAAAGDEVEVALTGAPHARWLLVLRIVGFLTNVEHGAAMDNALIEWAEWKMQSDPDIARMVEILERRA